MPLTEKAKQLLGGDVDAFEKALEGLKSAKSLDDIKQLLKESGRRLDSLQDRVRREEERLGQLVKEAELQSRQILQDARNEASKMVKEAEKLRDGYLRNLQEVEAREKAVEWVKEEEAKLTARQKALEEREKSAQKLVSEATAKQDLYVSHLKALKVQEDALAKREREGTGKAPEPEAKKKVK